MGINLVFRTKILKETLWIQIGEMRLNWVHLLL